MPRHYLYFTTILTQKLVLNYIIVNGVTIIGVYQFYAISRITEPTEEIGNA